MLSTLYIKQKYENANIAVLPSDHIISDDNKFVDTLKIANDYLEKTCKDNIITIGINPNRPETGYGYIKCLEKRKNQQVIQVERFVEKPDFDRATEYVKNGNYLWNAGMFIFNINYMLKEFENKCPNTYNKLSKLPSINSTNYALKLKEVYNECESISIDYAIMEKSNEIKVIPSDFGWDDVGTWQSLERYLNKDLNDNICKGTSVEFVESSNCIVYGLNKKIILYDVNDLFVTEGEDVIVVTTKENMNKIKMLKKD